MLRHADDSPQSKGYYNKKRTLLLTLPLLKARLQAASAPHLAAHDLQGLLQV
jgi:hypothetical protein